MNCDCGTSVAFQFHQLACIDCGAGCCPTCAVPLESATYCVGCAQSLLEGAALHRGGPFDLH